MGKLQVNGNISSSGTISSGNGQLVMSSSGSLATYLTTTGGWARGWSFSVNDTNMQGFGFYGNGSTKINHFYIGAYDAAWMKVTPAGTVTATKFVGSLQGNADSATKWATARTITIGHKARTLDGSSNLTYSPVDIFWNTSTVNSTTDWNAILTPGVQMVHGGNGFTGAGNPGSTYYYGGLYTIGLGGTQEHGHIAQFYIPHTMSGSQGIIYRSGWHKTYVAWYTLLDSRNYTSYTVTKTGSGASGTWGINISGNAATATTASGVAWGNISSKPTLFYVYGRGDIGSSYNIDTMTINGLFEIRASSEVTISGTGSPTNGWYPCLSMYGSNCRMQIAGGNSYGFWIRGKQGPDPTLASNGWLKIQITQGYGSTLPSGSGYLAGTVFYKT